MLNIHPHNFNIFQGQSTGNLFNISKMEQKSLVCPVCKSNKAMIAGKNVKLGGKFEFHMENNESIYQFQINDLSNIAFSNLYDYIQMIQKFLLQLIHQGSILLQ